jgi:hypothetical protein
MASLCVPTEFELVYRDVEGGVTLFNADNLTTRVLMTNSTFVSIYNLPYYVARRFFFFRVGNQLRVAQRF